LANSSPDIQPKSPLHYNSYPVLVLITYFYLVTLCTGLCAVLLSITVEHVMSYEHYRTIDRCSSCGLAQRALYQTDQCTYQGVPRRQCLLEFINPRVGTVEWREQTGSLSSV